MPIVEDPLRVHLMRKCSSFCNIQYFKIIKHKEGSILLLTRQCFPCHLVWQISLIRKENKSLEMFGPLENCKASSRSKRLDNLIWGGLSKISKGFNICGQVGSQVAFETVFTYLTVVTITDIVGKHRKINCCEK